MRSRAAFTARVYESHAALVRDVKNPEARAGWARRFADMYAADNPRFNRKRFYQACKVSLDHQVLMALEGGD